jgi:hypothetical protein
MVTTTDPTGAASAWTTFVVDTSNHLYGGASCGSVSLCVAVGEDYVVTSTAPRRQRLPGAFRVGGPGYAIRGVACDRLLAARDSFISSSRVGHAYAPGHGIS